MRGRWLGLRLGVVDKTVIDWPLIAGERAMRVIEVPRRRRRDSAGLALFFNFRALFGIARGARMENVKFRSNEMQYSSAWEYAYCMSEILQSLFCFNFTFLIKWRSCINKSTAANVLKVFLDGCSLKLQRLMWFDKLFNQRNLFEDNRIYFM